MKDLYTFDIDQQHALQTYDKVRAAYEGLFDELKIPYVVAEADSGNMGGNLSHEFHFESDAGEDNIIGCSSCNYVANEEKAVASISDDEVVDRTAPVLLKMCTTKGGRDLVVAAYPSQGPDGQGPREINWHALKRVVPDIVPEIADPFKSWTSYRPADTEEAAIPRKVILAADHRVASRVNSTTVADAARLLTPSEDKAASFLATAPKEIHHLDTNPDERLNLLTIHPGDACPKCATGTLTVRRAVELGHTFHLGTRYTIPLNATVHLPVDTSGSSPGAVPLHMGCHGIGVSRLMGAAASILADERGLNWPRAIAPFEAIVIPAAGFEEAAMAVYDALDDAGVDVAVDDRERTMPWRMNDADLIGYPVILIVSKRSWGAGKGVEVQCRRFEGGYKQVHWTEEEDWVGVVKRLLNGL